MQEQIREKMEMLETDPEFIAKMQRVKTTEDVINLMAEYGVELSEEEFESAYDQSLAIFEEKGYIKDNELTEDYLEMVSGGVNSKVAGVGVVIGYIGLGIMTGGGAWYLWAAGCAIGAAGCLMKGKRKK